jgi:hypothetical protein
MPLKKLQVKLITCVRFLLLGLMLQKRKRGMNARRIVEIARVISPPRFEAPFKKKKGLFTKFPK